MARVSVARVWNRMRSTTINRNVRRGTHVLVMACCAVGMTGCHFLPTGLENKEIGTYDRPYPAQLPQSEVLDIQVIREPQTTITLTNTTAKSFGPSTLWLNACFGRPIEGMLPGQTLSLSLKEFRDEFGDRFRAGGFFATKAPEVLVQAQLETIVDGQSMLYGLIVVGEDK